MRKSIIRIVLSSALLVSALSAQASTLTFADLPGDEVTPVANGYGGFNWNAPRGVYSLNKNYWPGSGYDYGAVSSNNTIFNGYGNTPTVISRTDGSKFTFNSMTLTSAWYDQSVTLSGLLNGNVIKTDTFNISTTLPLFISENWSNIDSLKIDSTNMQWAMGNFTYGTYATPIPAAVWLFASAVMGLGVFRKKTKA